MALSEEMLRKIYGMKEPTGPADPAVFARRRFHEAAARWLAKWLVPLQIFFAFIGFFVVLLPVLSKPWRSIVESIPVLAEVFHAYSTFSGLALFHLFAGMLTALTKPYWDKHSPSGPIPSYRDYFAPIACPMTRREEVSFWIEIVASILVTTFWLFLPFGALAYFIRIGG